jgi:hypothetical protein
MLLVVGISDRLPELRKARIPAHVLRRAGVLAIHAHSELEPQFGAPEVLDDDFVLPGVPKVILIAEAPHSFQGLDHGGGLLVQFVFGVVIDMRSPAQLSDPEVVQVTVVPAKGGLDHSVQLV